MTRPGVVCAGLLLLATVGCVNESFLSPFTPATRYRQVADGSPAVVASALEAGFGGVGITMFSKRHGEEVRLAGQTKSGDVFCIYIRPAAEGGTGRSDVTVKWDRRPDEELWKSMVGWMTASAPEGGASPKES